MLYVPWWMLLPIQYPQTLRYPSVPKFRLQTESIANTTEKMPAFSGTTEKCKACDKTVHFIELVSADGVSYHKTCFKCSHCSGHLVMSNYSSMDGVLYCKPHFDQLFKETGNFSKKFQASGKSEKQSEGTRAPSRLSSFFSGTQDKCATCKKTVYPLEKVTLEGENYHKSCFRCARGGCFLNTSSYAALDGVLYCKHHFAQLFKEKGSYNHVLKSAAVKKSAVAPLPEDESPKVEDDDAAVEQEES